MGVRRQLLTIYKVLAALALPLLLIPTRCVWAESSLTLDDLFSNPAYKISSPSEPTWSPDSKHFAYLWKPPGSSARKLWLVDSIEITPNEINLPNQKTSVNAFAWRDEQTLVVLIGSELWSTHIGSGAYDKIADVGTGISNFTVAPNGKTGAYLKGGDLWLVNLETGTVQQATKLGIPSLSQLPVGRYSRAEREIGPGIWGGPTYKWSNDSKFIALHVVDRRHMRKVAFPDYLAQDTDPNWVRRGYPGDANEKREIKLFDVAKGEIQSVSLPAPDARQVILFSWSADNALLIDTATDDAEVRSTWVLPNGSNEPEEIWRNERPSRMYTSFGASWHPNGKDIVLLSDLSERYGLYVIDGDATKESPKQLSVPDYDVLSNPIAAGNWLYYSGNGEGPSEQHVYRTDTNTGASQRLTTLPGTHSPYPSPDGRHLVIRSSTDTTPSDLFFVDAQRKHIPLTNSTSAEFKNQRWVKPRYVRFPSAIDKYTLHARILEPRNLDKTQKHPVVFGPVYSNTVRNRWRGVYSLMQQFLVQQGYIVVQVDMRGSTGYGRDFREEFLLDFAGDDLEDLASAVSYMKTLDYVDGDRIGIWGSSYGGTLSVYSVLKKPGLFRAAVAAASAVDPYFFGTDDVAIVRRPNTHPDIFARQAMKYVNNLEDHLLLIHGMQDHVVPFKTTATLADALIKAGKDFDFAFAPGATHAWSREPHYQRYLFNKLVEFFDRHLKSKESQ